MVLIFSLAPERDEYIALFPLSILFHFFSLMNLSLSIEIDISDFLNATPLLQIISLTLISEITFAGKGGSIAKVQIWSSLSSIKSKEAKVPFTANERKTIRNNLYTGQLYFN